MDPNLIIRNAIYQDVNCPRCKSSFRKGFSKDNVQCPRCHVLIPNIVFEKPEQCVDPVGDYSGQNNVYFRDGCPALMSDGRFITYYNRANELTEAMRKTTGIKSSNSFRTYLQTHGDAIMDAERAYQHRMNGCYAPRTACNEGFYDLWNIGKGSWFFISQ